MSVHHHYKIDLHPRSIITSPIPKAPAVFVTLQVYSPKCWMVEKVTSRVSEVSFIISPLALLHTYMPSASGFVRVTLQKRMTVPPRLTLSRSVVTTTTGRTEIEHNDKMYAACYLYYILPITCTLIAALLTLFP